ncbi:MAG: hypothetical protein JO015_14665 [Verrucomicrobia bacterium]|nr:hypothetical protein [Verrucomicrobiota bacterium]
MSRYLKAILVFDVALPLFGLALPCLGLLLMLLNLQEQQRQAAERYEMNELQTRQLTFMRNELSSVQDKAQQVKAWLSPENLESRIDQAVGGALERYTQDDIDRTLREYSASGPGVGSFFAQCRSLTLKFSARWETLNLAALHWESEAPNLLLESLTIQRATSGNGLESMLNYAVLTDE